MTDAIERALLTALSNLSGFRPEKAKRVFIIYETDIPGLVRDLRAGLAGVSSVEIINIIHAPTPARLADGPREVANDLPPSLAVKPNIAWRDQTLEQLYAERDYWVTKIGDATGWGGAVGSAVEFRNGCNAWISRRECEAREVVAEDYHPGCA